MIATRVSLPAQFDCQAKIGFIRWAKGHDIMMITENNCNGCIILTNGSLYIPSVDQSHSGVYIFFIVSNLNSAIFVHLTVVG